MTVHVADFIKRPGKFAQKVVMPFWNLLRWRVIGADVGKKWMDSSGSDMVKWGSRKMNEDVPSSIGWSKNVCFSFMTWEKSTE
jgi:hypothetical protein